MAANPVNQNLETLPAQAENLTGKNARRRLDFASLLRMLAIAAPLLLFAGAVVTGLVFFATLQPLFGNLAVGFTIGAGVLALLTALLLLES